MSTASAAGAAARLRANRSNAVAPLAAGYDSSRSVASRVASAMTASAPNASILRRLSYLRIIASPRSCGTNCMADAIGSAICWQVAVTDLAFAAVRAMRRSLFSCQPDSKRSAESASIRSRRFTNQPASSHNLPRRVTWRARLPCPSRSKRGRGLRRDPMLCAERRAFGVSSSVRISAASAQGSRARLSVGRALPCFASGLPAAKGGESRGRRRGGMSCSPTV
jgi:hypothetical protein